jgi:hypothetical protein
MVFCAAAIAAGGLVWWIHRPLDRIAPGTVCTRELALEAATADGLPWQRHRHTLNGPGETLDAGAYLIWNQRTGEGFTEDVSQLPDGRARFFVPTRYALLVNRDWDTDPWVVCVLPPPAEISRGVSNIPAKAA